MNGTPSELFAQRLRARREALGWTQVTLAGVLREETGTALDPTSITRIERGSRRISLNEAVALARVIGVDLPLLTTPWPVDVSEIAEQTPVLYEAPEGAGPHRRLGRITDAHLAEVVEIYQSAYEQGRPPTRAVANHYGASHSTAARWVGFARQKGLLAPAMRRNPARDGSEPA